MLAISLILAIVALLFHMSDKRTMLIINATGLAEGVLPSWWNVKTNSRDDGDGLWFKSYTWGTIVFTLYSEKMAKAMIDMLNKSVRKEQA